MNVQSHISPEEINGLVQREAGNEEFIQLSEERVDEIHNHLLECEECNRQYTFSKNTYEEISEELSEKVSRPGWYWVAAAVFFVISAYWLVFINSSDPNSEEELAEAEKIITPTENRTVEVAETQQETKEEVEVVPNYQLLAANFQPNPELEELIDNPLRSDNVEILSPLKGQKLMNKIRFEWTDVDSPLVLKIMNNQEDLVHESEVANGSYTFPQPLTPGRYYWSLEDEEEVLFYGTFFFRYYK